MSRDPGDGRDGALVLVAGPSGAGKDTLIAIARVAFAGEPRVVFCRRVVTRLATAHEGHDTMTEEDFAAAARAGAFTLHWRAHGLRYGLPAATTGLARRGYVVVANVSRGVLATALGRFPRVRIVIVTAPPDVLARRIDARGREVGARERLSRPSLLAAGVTADLTIENIGPPEEGARPLIALIASLLER